MSITKASLSLVANVVLPEPIFRKLQTYRIFFYSSQQYYLSLTFGMLTFLEFLVFFTHLSHPQTSTLF